MIEVRLLYEPRYIIPNVGNLKEKIPGESMFEFPSGVERRK
jgi:hypothetical protein